MLLISCPPLPLHYPFFPLPNKTPTFSISLTLRIHLYYGLFSILNCNCDSVVFSASAAVSCFLPMWYSLLASQAQCKVMALPPCTVQVTLWHAVCQNRLWRLNYNLVSPFRLWFVSSWHYSLFSEDKHLYLCSLFLLKWHWTFSTLVQVYSFYGNYFSQKKKPCNFIFPSFPFAYLLKYACSIFKWICQFCFVWL